MDPTDLMDLMIMTSMKKQWLKWSMVKDIAGIRPGQDPGGNPGGVVNTSPGTVIGWRGHHWRRFVFVGVCHIQPPKLVRRALQ